jgi:glutamyl-tRNA reductase
MRLLAQRFESIRRAELRRLEPKLSLLSPDARSCLDEISQRIVEQLLLTPRLRLESMRDHATRTRYCDALNGLFRLT